MPGPTRGRLTIAQAPSATLSEHSQGATKGTIEIHKGQGPRTDRTNIIYMCNQRSVFTAITSCMSILLAIILTVTLATSLNSQVTICMHMQAQHMLAYACICLHMHAYESICMDLHAYECTCTQPAPTQSQEGKGYGYS